MKSNYIILILSSLFLGTLSFSAEDSAGTKSKTSKKGVQYKKNTVLEFDGRSVDGNVVSPDSSDVEGDKNIKFEPLLEGRKDFKREFKRSSGVSR